MDFDMKDSEYQEHNICKNRRNYGDSPAYLNPLGFLAGNPATLVVGGSVVDEKSIICVLSAWQIPFQARSHYVYEPHAAKLIQNAVTCPLRTNYSVFYSLRSEAHIHACEGYMPCLVVRVLK